MGLHAPAYFMRGGCFTDKSRSMTSLKLSPGRFSALSLRYTESLREIVLNPMLYAYCLCTDEAFVEVGIWDQDAYQNAQFPPPGNRPQRASECGE